MPSTLSRPPRKRRARLYIIIALVLGALVFAGQTMRRRGAKKATPVTVEAATLRTITQTVSATGKIQPEVEVKISAEVAGEIVEMPFREGATVRKGDLLLRIKADNYEFLVEQREADLVSARASAVQSKSRLAKAREDFERIRGLHEKNLVSDSDFTAARTSFEVAQAENDNVLAQIRRAEGTLKQSKDQLTKTTVYAPMDGTISSLTSEVGERVVATGQFSGTEVMRVADLSNMEVRVNVNENDIVNVKPGDTARITIDAYPNRRFAGIVKEIASTARTTGQMTQEEVTNFQVKIRITDKNVEIRPGMSASVDVETRTVANVVAVPTQAVTVRSRKDNKTLDQVTAERAKLSQEKQGDSEATVVNEKERRAAERADREALQRVVFLLDGEKVKMVPVDTGIADTTHTEIKSGLKEGDQIVSGSFTIVTRTLTDGMQVRVETPKTPGAKPDAKP